MPDSDPPPPNQPNAAPQGFDPRKELEKRGPEPIKPRGGDITMGVPTNAEDERRKKQREAEQAEASRRNRNTINTSTWIPARILWPALGFPAVITPNSGDPSLPARTICLLLLSQRDPQHNPLSKEDVARHLRIVEWAKRREKRWLPMKKDGGTNAFSEEEIVAVRHREGTLNDGRAQIISIGADDDGQGGFALGLSMWVKRFYANLNPSRDRLFYLYEVRIAEHAAAALGEGRFHLFWVNKSHNDTAEQRSGEMDVLLESFARYSRFGNDGVLALKHFVGKQLQSYEHQHMREYEYEFSSTTDAPDRRAEVLHPVFIRKAPEALRVAHISDLHMDHRIDAYEKRLADSPDRPKAYHNWNRASIDLYRQARADSDAILMVGDLIDYGRGYKGSGPMDDMNSYWRDRNWFLFYEALARGDDYSVPVYTILGNHDWRLNPYPSATRGAPDPESMNLTKEQVEIAHGPGGDKLTYEIDLALVAKAFVQLLGRTGELDLTGLPTETRVESVAWYLLQINPFFDYVARLPGGYNLVMLDWAEDEIVSRELIIAGEDYGRQTPPNTYGGPQAKNNLTPVQRELVEYAAAMPRGPRILAVHAPPVAPWAHWSDDELARGRVNCNPADVLAYWDEPIFKGTEGHRIEALKRLRGATLTPKEAAKLLRDKKPVPRLDYPALAIRVDKDDLLGREANYGSFGNEPERVWLVRKLREWRFNLVLSGHNHRRQYLVVDNSGAPPLMPESKGKWVVRLLDAAKAKEAPGPLYVNGPSAGPRGNIYRARGVYKVAESEYIRIVINASGTLEALEVREYRAPSTPAPQAPQPPAPAPAPAK